jgi:hypothetical protein
VHDRRIDGQTEVFGNYGALFRNAMTWYDHSTQSVWSQPWGRAIVGELKGVELFLLPSQIASWGSWLEAYPDTLVMSNDLNQLGTFREIFDPDFVIGLLIAGQAKAYYFGDVLEAGVVSDHLGDTPILVWAEEGRFHAYVRQVDDLVLTFKMEGGELFDAETGSRWDVSRGLAIEGPLQGQSLLGVPGSSAFDWAWLDFYPESEFFTP